MTAGQLTWAGFLCCVGALCIQMFPGPAFGLGIDVGASWQLFCFGVFIILVGAMLATAAGRRQAPLE